MGSHSASSSVVGLGTGVTAGAVAVPSNWSAADPASGVCRRICRCVSYCCRRACGCIRVRRSRSKTCGSYTMEDNKRHLTWIQVRRLCTHAPHCPNAVHSLHWRAGSRPCSSMHPVQGVSGASSSCCAQSPPPPQLLKKELGHHGRSTRIRPRRQIACPGPGYHAAGLSRGCLDAWPSPPRRRQQQRQGQHRNQRRGGAAKQNGDAAVEGRTERAGAADKRAAPAGHARARSDSGWRRSRRRRRRTRRESPRNRNPSPVNSCLVQSRTMVAARCAAGIPA